MPQQPALPEIAQIFLSATAQDCKDYREAVCKAVQNSIRDAKIFLQEHWAEGVQPVVDLCETRVKKQSDGYIGLFGHRYGWVPNGFTKSITELEFSWALERWTALRVPPIFIMLPLPQSDADKLLAAAAKPFIERDFPAEDQRADAMKRQQDFVAAVRKWAAVDGRMLTFYADQTELVLKAVSNIQNWNLDVVRRAPGSRRAASGDIPTEELGRIGREAQIDTLVEALDALHAQAQQRAMAVLVHGAENHGQREFADLLLRWDKWEDWDDTKVFLGQPANPGDTGALARWACSQLQEPASGADAVAALAATLATRLEHSSVVFITRSLGRQPERLASFVDTLWRPLVAALAARVPAATKGRLLWFVCDHEPQGASPALWPGAADAADIDRLHLLPLPVLGTIDAKQVRNWLQRLKDDAGIELDPHRRGAIAARATHPDGDPPNVYDRLDREGFWSPNH